MYVHVFDYKFTFIRFSRCTAIEQLTTILDPYEINCI